MIFCFVFGYYVFQKKRILMKITLGFILVCEKTKVEFRYRSQIGFFPKLKLFFQKKSNFLMLSCFCGISFLKLKIEQKIIYFFFNIWQQSWF